MLSIILDIGGGYLVAKFIKNIWFALIAAIAVGIASSVVVNMLIYVIASDVVMTEEIIISFALGVYLHPIVAIVSLLIFRRNMKRKSKDIASI